MFCEATYQLSKEIYGHYYKLQCTINSILPNDKSKQNKYRNDAHLIFIEHICTSII